MENYTTSEKFLEKLEVKDYEQVCGGYVLPVGDKFVMFDNEENWPLVEYDTAESANNVDKIYNSLNSKSKKDFFKTLILPKYDKSLPKRVYTALNQEDEGKILADEQYFNRLNASLIFWAYTDD